MRKKEWINEWMNEAWPWTMRYTCAVRGLVRAWKLHVYGPSSATATRSIWMEKSLSLLLAIETRESRDHFSFPVNRMLERFSHALWVTSSSILHLWGDECIVTCDCNYSLQMSHGYPVSAFDLTSSSIFNVHLKFCKSQQDCLGDRLCLRELPYPAYWFLLSFLTPQAPSWTSAPITVYTSLRLLALLDPISSCVSSTFFFFARFLLFKFLPPLILVMGPSSFF